MAKSSRQQDKGRRGGKRALRGQQIELEISDMAQGGRGLGWHGGRPVFVPFTLPGESITAAISGERGKALFARGLKLVAASDDRVTPRCPHFGPGRCWGCQWQHIDYPAQLLLKQDVLADQLSRLGKLPDTTIEAALKPVLPAQKQWGFNHTIVLSRTAEGEWGLRRDGGGIEAIGECPVTQSSLLDLAASLNLDYARARRLLLRRGSDGQHMLIFYVDAEEAPELQTDLPLSVNLILPDREPINLIGDAYSRFTIAGREFRVTAGAFFRPNLEGMGQLVAEVLRALQLTGRERALDLFAGVGVFSAFMAGDAALVTLVESYPPAVTDADVNLGEFDTVDVIEGQVEKVLADMAAEGARYDVAVVDPPSSGLGQETIQRLARLDLARLVYVSGDPASLARDSRQLIDLGYALREIQPIDLAPQAYYITAVARFER